MSYFTETFEGILEFKGDVANSYARRRDYERGTHSHTSGKHAAQMAKSAVRNHDEYVNGSGQAELRKQLGNTTKEKYDDYNSDMKYRSKQMHKRLDAERKNAKANHESYDSVYNDLVNMGIID